MLVALWVPDGACSCSCTRWSYSIVDGAILKFNLHIFIRWCYCECFRVQAASPGGLYTLGTIVMRFSVESGLLLCDPRVDEAAGCPFT